MNELNYPTYPSYKDSGIPWLGEIPEGWEVRRNLGLFDERKEVNFSEKQLLSVTIDRGIILQSEITSKKDSSKEDKSKYKLVRVGDLAYNKMRMWQGAIGCSEHEGIVSPAYIILAPREVAYARYFHYLYRTTIFIKEANRNSYGLCDDMNSLRYEDFKNIYSPVPPKEDIIRIVAFLDRKTAEVDEAIAKKQRLIELLNEQKAILINRAVTRGLNPDAPLKDSGVSWIGEIPAHWQTLPMRWIVKIATGGKDTVDRIDDGKYPFFVRSEKVERINSYSMDCEAVLTSGDGAGVGKIFHHVNGKFDFHQRVYAFTEFKSVTGRYFYYFLSSLFGYQMAQNMAKSTVDSVRLPFLKEMIFCIPPISEQNHIVAILDNKIESINEFGNGVLKSIEKLQEYKQILIAHAVTGKIRVPEA